MADDDAEIDVLGGNAQGLLRSIVERVENLIRDRNEINEDIREVFVEAKSHGFDSKIIRKVIKIRATDKAKLQEEEALIDLYMSAIGGL